jgi:hypothetical protein
LVKTVVEIKIEQKVVMCLVKRMLFKLKL